jgi:hypothetical protein
MKRKQLKSAEVIYLLIPQVEPSSTGLDPGL